MAEFVIQPQKQSEWCWAATAASVAQYFDPTTTLEQCDVVNILENVSDCCANPSSYNQPADLASAIQTVGCLRLSLDRALTFDELRQEIDAGRPVCAGIAWDSGGGHAVLITAYNVLSSGSHHIHVEDPLNPSGDVDFDEFSNAYHGDGKWEATELLAVPRGVRL